MDWNTIVLVLTAVTLAGTILGVGGRLLRKLDNLMGLPDKFDNLAKKVEDIEKRLDANIFTRRRR